jgi:superfamily II DNA or RNA helicase
VVDQTPSASIPAPRLEDLVPGIEVGGLVGATPVTVVQVQWHGVNFITLTYKDGHGDTGQIVVGRDKESSLRVTSAGTGPAFDGDPESWRIGAEALRIHYAALFDPMLAITTSDLDALPHQITAVYGELLPRTPLRFLLADDPGAGKTIMAGLYIKELILRGDLARCMIVSPGGLAEQWQDELFEKFGLKFEILTRSMIDSDIHGDVFTDHPLMIARMDMLSRDEELQARLERSDWDLIVVDEAHRMSAHYFGQELKTTKRYQLGLMLGKICRHLLLMTATPHAGNQENFQLFLALLDGDRFEGKYRDGVHSIDIDDMMRRMVKEELLTMEGTPLFPERRAYTVPYALSDEEQELYEAVSEYVRDEMNRADRLKAEGDGRRGNTVGFALTVLQRRLASSPEAIWKSLQRRRDRLEARRIEMTQIANASVRDSSLEKHLRSLLERDLSDDDLDDIDDIPESEIEDIEENVVDAATAAQTVAELENEIKILESLAELARRVRFSGTDKKWTELRTILSDNALTKDESGNLRKIIIFTEHKDTMVYLIEQIRTLIGRDEAVVAIHGGVGREDRRKVQNLFTQDKDVRVLVATDAAGEGLNLQRAHLMVNYDLPWNPNRIEQRFGRIHRIGQKEVCHLWNLVAANTREGEVFQRLLQKIEEQRIAYKGKVFDVLGEAFAEEPLRKLLIEAIRYGDKPSTRERLNEVIDSRVGEGLDVLIAERALHTKILALSDIEEIKRRIEDLQARRLQPHYIQSFFLSAFNRLGGRAAAREAGKWEVTHVPSAVRDRDRQIGTGAPVLSKYERITFERKFVNVAGEAKADLVAPGHPLLDAVVDLMIEQNSSTLKHGAVLIDTEDQGETPRLLVAMTQSISDGNTPARTISKRFDFVELTSAGEVFGVGQAPYLDYSPAPEDVYKKARSSQATSWDLKNMETLAMNWAIENSLPEHQEEVTAQVIPATQRSREQVRKRLISEINYWDTRHAELIDQEAAGKALKIKPETAQRRARDLERRLEIRLAELDSDSKIVTHPPALVGIAMVLPQGFVDRLNGERTGPVSSYAKETAEVDRRAVAAAMAAERSIGRTPEEMPHNNPGFDIRSVAPDGTVIKIEVKGRIEGATDFQITRREVLTAKNLEDNYRLALVKVSQAGPDRDEIRYVERPFDLVGTEEFSITRFTVDWNNKWKAGSDPR